jgi:hypothetical protein
MLFPEGRTADSSASRWRRLTSVGRNAAKAVLEDIKQSTAPSHDG